MSWFPFVVRGWGANGESWLIDEGIARGIDEVLALEATEWTIGRDVMRAGAVAIDAANGNVRVDLQTWAQANASLRMLLHGRDNLSLPIVQRYARDPKKTGTKKMLSGVRYYYTDVGSWKTRLAGRIANADGPGWHTCTGLDVQYIGSLGSEHQVEARSATGRPVQRWVPREVVNASGLLVERTDTHFWDCEHMQLAAAHVLGWDELKEETAVVTEAPSRRDGWDSAVY
jgi:hypothetical protein